MPVRYCGAASSFRDRPDISFGGEVPGIQQIVTEDAIETLDFGLLLRLTELNEGGRETAAPFTTPAWLRRCMLAHGRASTASVLDDRPPSHKLERPRRY